MQTVAVLFARADSNYKVLPGVDVYDVERDARTYDGPHPVVAHPPCRAWGRLRTFANPRPDERNLGRLAIALVCEFGGVLEHPAGSTLWSAQRLPKPGMRDSWGGGHWLRHRSGGATRRKKKRGSTSLDASPETYQTCRSSSGMQPMLSRAVNARITDRTSRKLNASTPRQLWPSGLLSWLGDAQKTNPSPPPRAFLILGATYMQDKIPDALIAAFERHYDADWNLNQLRNERLAWRAAWAEATKPCLHQITEPQAAPEAAAVPDEREAFEKWASFVGYSIKRWQADANLYEDNGTEDAWIAWQARAALAATPAAAARLSRAEAAITIRNLKREIAEKEAAAPVVLPEPEHDDAYTRRVIEALHENGDPVSVDAAEEMERLRALLATATGLPAQAVPDFCHVASLKLKNLQERGYQITGYAIEKPVEGAMPGRGFINHGGFVGWWLDGQSPQAQADARDDSALLDAMERQRIAVVPEYEGPWDAEVYNDEGKPNHRGTGSTPREAIRAAIAAAKVE